MQITNNFSNIAAIQPNKSGNNLPTENSKNSFIAEKSSSIRDLSKTIDPTNMSRNDARSIAIALGQAGELELDNAFVLESMILVNDGGSLRSANENDPIMNEKFNMFDALRSNIEFKKSHGLSTDNLEKALEFLDYFQKLRENPEVDFYA